MNLKFIDDILNMVKSTLINFSLVVGLHFIAYGAYISYKHFNNKGVDKNSKNKDKNSNDKNVNDIQMEKIENIENIENELDASKNEDDDEELSRLKCINEYKLVLEKKQQVLSSLIMQLDTISSDILKIKEKLENVSNINNRQIT